MWTIICHNIWEMDKVWWDNMVKWNDIVNLRKHKSSPAIMVIIPKHNDKIRFKSLMCTTPISYGQHPAKQTLQYCSKTAWGCVVENTQYTKITWAILLAILSSNRFNETRRIQNRDFISVICTSVRLSSSCSSPTTPKVVFVYIMCTSTADAAKLAVFGRFDAPIQANHTDQYLSC